MIRPKVSKFFSLFGVGQKGATFAALLCTLLLFLPQAFAADPTLTPKDTEPLPTTIKENSVKTFTLRYQDKDGDAVKSSAMIVKTPQGQATLPGKAVNGDAASGIDINWDAKLTGAGEYTASFVVTSADGTTVTYPAKDQEPYKFVVQNPMIQWAIFGGGVVVGLFFLPFLVYAISRSMNKNGDPTRAARGALLLGILMCGGLFIWLFASFYGPLAIGIGVVGALALIVMVLTRK